jgi:pilus assembly protein Flp/PilA
MFPASVVWPSVRFLFFCEGSPIMKKLLRNLVRGEEGATLVEYGLLVGLIAVVAIAGITLMGTSVQTLFNYLAGEIPTGS